MEREIELATLDLRYESYRMKNPAVEARLLAAIAERGIEEPLEGVDRAPQSILLNGFKRYRCAVKLGMGLANTKVSKPRLAGSTQIFNSSCRSTPSIHG